MVPNFSQPSAHILIYAAEGILAFNVTLVLIIFSSMVQSYLKKKKKRNHLSNFEIIERND